MITLIIKGDMSAASLAASAHGVKLASLHAHPQFRECIGVASADALPQIIEWFCEPGEAPFADGALTFYTQGNA